MRYVEAAKLGMLLGAVIGWLIAVATGHGQIESLLIQFLMAGLGSLIGAGAGILIAVKMKRR